jgi:hypothetical protein
MEPAEVISISTNDPMLKLAFAFEFVRGCTEERIRVDYIDFDLQFSSLIHNLPIDTSTKLFANNKIIITQPFEKGFDETVITSQLDSLELSEGFVVLDSINMMQNMLASFLGTSDQLKANHQTALLISLLQLLGRKSARKVLALSLDRSRPRAKPNNSVEWEKGAVGGRIMNYKSDLTLVMNRSSETLVHNGISIELSVREPSSKTSSDPSKFPSVIWLREF